MKQTTLFGGLPATITTGGTIKHEGRGTLVPHLKNDVQFVYDEAEKTFDLIKQLLPNIRMELVTSTDRLQEYLEAIKKNGIVSIDTEGNGLNPRLDALAGMSLYTPNEASIYVPINHDFYEHNMGMREFTRELNRLASSGKIRIVMHNMKYDTRVLYNYTQEWTPVFADTMVAAHMLDENEPKGLKYQWNKNCMGGRYSEMTYSDLFDKHKFGSFNPEKVYVYAALDTIMTLQLWMYQFQYIGRRVKDGAFEYGSKVASLGLEQVSNWFWDNEMKVTRIAAMMEERGVAFDAQRNTELGISYGRDIGQVRRKAVKEANILLDKYGHNIPRDKFFKINNPISLSSDMQVAYLLYDGVGVQLNDVLLRQVRAKKEKTAKKAAFKKGIQWDSNAVLDLNVVGSAAIKYFIKEYPELEPFLTLLLEYRDLDKIESTFILSLRAQVDPISHRVHGGWNNLGTKTGRFSSSKPNL